VGVMRRIILSGVSCIQSESSPKIACILAGIPEHVIEDVKISDVVLVTRGGGAKSDADLQIPEKEEQYPEPNMFGVTPAHGFFLRHLRGLEMQGVKIEAASPDARPTFVLEDVQDATFGRLKVPFSGAVPAFVLHQVKDISVFRSKPVPDTEIMAAENKEI